MKKQLAVLLMILGFIGTFSSVWANALDNSDTRYPERKYRRFLLPNRLKVLLVSDPTLQKGAASLSIAVGSISDPVERPGLAHFLEHMLFLGTEKYPDPGSYQEFVSTHDGFSNAYTAEDHTNYHFEIAPEQLEEGLDRFSQFFIAPLFNQDLVEREKNAVESEHSKNIPNDFRRVFQVKRLAYEQGHPAQHFATGNLKTLEGVSKEELLGFYQKYYSSNQMTLSVAGPQDLDTLQNWVVPRFNTIKNHNRADIKISSQFMKPDSRFRLLQVKTVKDSRSLTMMFPLPKTLHYYKSQPLGMMGFLLGHEGKGSLLSQLKKENLVTGISAGSGYTNQSYSSFDINIQLTPKGLKKHSTVVQRVFQYIVLLRKTGLPKSVFEEVKRMSEIDYRFAQKAEGTRLVNVFSSLMLYYPLRDLEKAPYLINEYKPRLFDSLLYRLTPQNMLAILAARNVKTDEKDEYYGAEYSLTYQNQQWIKKWKTRTQHANLKLPEANPFLPENLDVLPFEGQFRMTHQTVTGLKQEGLSAGVVKRFERAQGEEWDSFNQLMVSADVPPHADYAKQIKKFLRKHAVSLPEMIRDNEYARLWFQQDYRFQTPKATLLFRIHSPEVYSSAKNAVISQLYVEAIKEGLNEFGYPVRLAGLEYGIHVDKESINLSFSGYSDRLQELVKTVSARLKEIRIDKKTFETLKEMRIRRYQNFHFQQPFQQAFYFRSLLLEGKKFSIMEYEKIIKKIRLKDLQQFADKVYQHYYIEGFAYGNLRQQPVLEALDSIQNDLDGQPLPGSQKYQETIRQISPNNSHTYTRLMQVENSALVTDMQVGQRTPELKAAMLVLETVLNPQFYNELRTQQQLGYIVNSGITEMEKTISLILILQSGEYNTEVLEQKQTAFMNQFFETLMNLSPDELESLKKAVLNGLLQKSSSVSAEASRLHTLAYEYGADFDINSKTIQALEKLTVEDLSHIVRSSFLPARQRTLFLRMSGKNHDAGESSGLGINTIGDFRTTIPCPESCMP